MMWALYKKYLTESHKDQILEIMRHEDVFKHFPLCIQYINLFDISNFGNEFLKNPSSVIEQSDRCLQEIQKEFLECFSDENVAIKQIHTRIYELPGCPEIHRTKFPTNDDVGCMLQVSGTVVRITTKKMLEHQRYYICVRCKYTFLLQADYDKKYVIIPPKKCCNPEKCKGMKIVPLHSNLVSEYCCDYQEIKMQEKIGKSGIGSMPSTMWVTLEDDLVDNCKPGDDVTICGIINRRWGPSVPGKKIDVELVLRAYHIQVNNEQNVPKIVTKELRDEFKQFWTNHKQSPLNGRDVILKSFCPQIFGLYAIKLAVAIILAGGTEFFTSEEKNYARIRSQSHILLIGDPGTGKSQLLKFASNVITRSVLTTGIGSTSAGLTVTAVKENGEWQLEAGALVLADGGICCIDEFNSMKEQDRLSIHEAMEQQTISVAKAGIVCKLSTRCSIVAATNPKGKIDPDQPLSINTGLATPLLSRFDLVFILRDKVNAEWDELVAEYILNDCNISKDSSELDFWTLDRLQVYFNTVKSLQPVLSADANSVLRTYYQYQRRAPSRNKARTTVRLLDSLVRLSQGHARLMYRTEVTVTDAVIAVYLAELSLHDECTLVSEPFDNIHSVFPQNPALAYCKLAKEILSGLHLQHLMHKEVQQNVNVQQYLHNSDEGRTNENANDISILKNVEKQTDDINQKLFTSTPKQVKATADDIPRSDFQHRNMFNIDLSNEDCNFSMNSKKAANTREKTKCETVNDENVKGKTGRRSKQIKRKKRNEEVDDFELLKQIPSVNDNFTSFSFDSQFMESGQFFNASETPEQFKCNSPSPSSKKPDVCATLTKRISNEEGVLEIHEQSQQNYKRTKTATNGNRNVAIQHSSGKTFEKQFDHIEKKAKSAFESSVSSKLSSFKFRKMQVSDNDSKNASDATVSSDGKNGKNLVFASENSIFKANCINTSDNKVASINFKTKMGSKFRELSDVITKLPEGVESFSKDIYRNKPETSISNIATKTNDENIFSQIDDDFDFDTFNLDL